MTGVSEAAAGIISHMGAAGFSALCAQGAVAMVEHKGHLGRAAEKLAKSSSVKSLLEAMAVAGLVQGVGQAIGAPISASDAKGLAGHAQRQALHQGVGAAVSMAFGQNPVEAAKGALAGGVAGVAGGVSANAIGQAYANHMMDAVTHKLLHAVSAASIGAAAGTALGNDARRMALSAAIGGVAAETMADIISEDANIVAGRVEVKAAEQGLDVRNEAHRNALINAEIRTRLELSKLSGAMAAFLSGQDVGAGAAAAAIAIENNAAQALTAAIGAALLRGGRAAIPGDGFSKNTRQLKKDLGIIPEGDETPSVEEEAANRGSGAPDPDDDHNKDQEKFSKVTKDLLKKTDTFKEELFERSGKSKSDTTLDAARKELNGEQIPLAQERGRTFDHVKKVQQAQQGLLNLIERINRRLGFSELPVAERQPLQQELSKVINVN